MLKPKPVQYLLATLSFVLFVVVGYGISRDDTASLFLCYFILFCVYLLLIRQNRNIDDDALNIWIIVSLLFRAGLLFSIPTLSDDFYRFIWDGRILAAGENPFTHVPAHYMQASNNLPGLDNDLFGKLNSKDRFSSYPPVCQFIFWISVKLSPDSLHGSVLMMKNVLFLFEIGTLWILKRLVVHFRLPPSRVLIYALNPLVILEIVGNLHFEGVMIFFLMLAIYLIAKHQMILSAAFFALSVCTKLIPLLFLPLFYHPLGKKKALSYWAMTGGIVILAFLPLLDAPIAHGFTSSLGYYFQRFEFNASLYYLIRAIGYLTYGFNIIHYAGPVLALMATVGILYVAFGRYRSASPFDVNPALAEGMLWCLSIYFISTTVLHPWYIITLLAISVFTKYRYPLIWTGFIFLTYEGYEKYHFEENLLLVALEYLAVIAYAFYEMIWTRRQSLS